MSAPRRLLGLLLVLGALLPCGSAFGAKACPEAGHPGYVDEIDAMSEALAALGARQTPDARPSSIQITAPGITGSPATTLVSGAEAPSLLGLATDSGIIESKDGLRTLNLNAFALQMLRNPAVWTDQALYEQYSAWRRLSATLSSGGKGESFDRDGDGKADPALEAKDLGDILNWEGRLRLGPSRDHRERGNAEVFRRETKAAVERLGSLEETALRRIFARADYPVRPTNDQGDRLACVNAKDLERFINQPDVRRLLSDLTGELAETSGELEKAWATAAQEVSNHFVSSVAVGGVQRKHDFGRDEIYVAFRGDRPLANEQTFKVNLQWTRIVGLEAGDPDPESIKAGAEWATLWHSSLSKKGVVVSFAANGEHYHQVPTAKHDTIATLGAKLELPLPGGFKLPLAITWANHKDLLTDASEIAGHFALSYDLSKLLDN